MGLQLSANLGVLVSLIWDRVWDMNRRSSQGRSRGQGIVILLVVQLKYRLLVGSIQLVLA